MKEESTHSLSFFEPRVQWTQGFVPEPFHHMKLDSYPRCSDEHCNALRAAQAYVQDIRDGAWRPLVLFGRSGSGKTMMASCVFNELAPGVPDRRFHETASEAGTADNLCFVHCAGLVSGLRQDDQPASPRAQRRYRVASALLAVLDDLDKFPAGEWGNELLSIIDSRVWSGRLPTIVTMNLTPPAFARRYGEQGEPMLGRLIRAGGVFIRLDAPCRLSSGKEVADSK